MANVRKNITTRKFELKLIDKQCVISFGLMWEMAKKGILG